MNRFNKFLNYIFKVEGGYTDDKNDRGGKTTWGITEEEARDFGYTGDMQNLTKDFAKNIYLKKYYLGNKLDKIIDDRVALSIFDWAVNSGRRGIKKAQIVANKFGANLVIDGIIGNKTLEAINSMNPEEFLKEYHELQRTFYKNLAAKDSTQEDFLKGWLNRVEIKEKFIERLM
jgi:putative secretion activating protein|nr:MAG TPA: Lysozyme [Caudoviricetes sp.]